EVHVRRRVEADVYDLVVDRKPALADPRFDAPAQLHRLAVNGRLSHNPLGVQHPLVAVPALAVTGEPSGHEADAPVQSVLLGRAHELVELDRKSTRLNSSHT